MKLYHSDATSVGIRRFCRFSILVSWLLLGGMPVLLSGKTATWTGDPWGPMTRDQMVEIADEMIDSTWSPRRTIHNYRSPTRPRTTFEEGVTYRGVAYNMVYEADDWDGFLGKVENTSGGDTDYGNDCSAFISIAWRLPRRLNTVRFEDEVTGPAELAHSLGEIGDGASVPLIQGDVLNRSGNHNIMFDRYSSSGVVSMEQTPGPRNTALPHQEMRRNWTWSSLSNYRPIRRNEIEGEDARPSFLEGDWARTTASSLNFREGPGTDYDAFDQLPYDTTVRILPHDDNGIRVGANNWWYVARHSDGAVGWLAEYYLEATYAPSGEGWVDIVIDNEDPGFSASGGWETSSSGDDFYGTDYRYHVTGGTRARATWTADLPHAGRYRVQAWWPARADHAFDAPYSVRHSGGETDVERSQAVGGGRWNVLGTFEFEPGEARVRLSVAAASGDFVAADAVRFMALDPAPPFENTFAEWRLSQFTSSELDREGWTEPADDPFGHGIPNLAAFAFGMDARTPDTAALPRIEIENGAPALQFERLRDTADVDYVVEVSSDLTFWSELSLEGAAFEIPAGADSLTETVRLPLPFGNPAPAQFVRVRIVQVEP